MVDSLSQTSYSLGQRIADTRIVVQKYGGTSVATPRSRQLVCSRIQAAKACGYSVLAVISAMGRKGAPYATDTLLSLLDGTVANARERDMLFSCGEIIAGVTITAQLQTRGCSAVFLTGRQAGIVTDSSFGEAEILDLDPKCVSDHLNAGRIVVVAGSQGATSAGEITSLGRGGSDITACALGVALEAERIEIYTDVAGIMTADPHLVPEAKLLPEISYRDCLRMASEGAKVMHPKAVAIAAKRPHTSLWVGSTYGDSLGTVVR